MSQYVINENWQLHAFPMCVGPERHSEVEGTKDGWMDCTVPCDMTAVLVREGIVPEPTVSDADLAQLDWVCCVEGERSIDSRGDVRRAFLRKPQYVFGWDWSPGIATCGIADNVTVYGAKDAPLRVSWVF